ncbi:holo-ACP synthase [Metasolibacillus meyeri]|uniref:holo-ACP synthase n=1 Tax=Metasolibacillus meyeri TaxID=1071052 RepID=UPI000D2F9841|nr:holo-ACP synthase [Metasolibacillus meyeri]
MIKGIGLDIIELERIEKAMQRSEKFTLRILSPREQALFAKLSNARKVEFLAGRFAAKEAYAKANGTGLGKGCELQQIEILKNELGAPQLFFDGEPVKGFITITHTQTVAAAQVVLME